MDADEKVLNEIAPSTVAWNEDQKTVPEYRTVPSNNVRVWQAKKGASLKTVLEKWSAEENISISWNTDQNYSIALDTFISGTFENALDVLLSKGLEDAPEYRLNDNPYQLRIGNIK